MKMPATVCAVFLAGFLAACQTTRTLSTPPVTAQFSSETVRKDVEKYVILQSRTTALNDKKRRVETDGVPCAVEGNGFSLNYRTPANLKLPVFGVRTSDLSMSCTYEGAKKYKSIKVRNLTAERIANAGAGGGLIGSLIASGFAASRGNKPGDDYTYASLSMFLDQ